MNFTLNNSNNTICISSDTAELSKVREFILQNAIAFGFSDEQSYKISLAVDEACSNLIRHAFKLDAKNNIYIEIEISTGIFSVKILDNGIPFDPLTVESPDMKEYFKQFKHGGLGIYIMRSVMDEIKYFPSSNNNSCNILKLTKLLS
jgi:serine/threonine-protein kinase RsbW